MNLIASFLISITPPVSASHEAFDSVQLAFDGAGRPVEIFAERMAGSREETAAIVVLGRFPEKNGEFDSDPDRALSEGLVLGWDSLDQGEAGCRVRMEFPEGVPAVQVIAVFSGGSRNLLGPIAVGSNLLGASASSQNPPSGPAGGKVPLLPDLGIPEVYHAPLPTTAACGASGMGDVSCATGYRSTTVFAVLVNGGPATVPFNGVDPSTHVTFVYQSQGSGGNHTSSYTKGVFAPVPGYGGVIVGLGYYAGPCDLAYCPGWYWKVTSFSAGADPLNVVLESNELNNASGGMPPQVCDYCPGGGTQVGGRNPGTKKQF